MSALLRLAPPDEAVRTVLCVDDEPHILSALRRLLRPGGWRVLTAGGPTEALAVLEQETVDVVVSDMRMPGMDGAHLLERVARRWPQAVRLLLTGHADVGAVTAAVNRGRIWRCIHKPWDDEDLLQAVRQAFERNAQAREKRRLQQLTRQHNDELTERNAALERRVDERTAQLAEAHERLKRAYLATIRSFSALAEMRSPHLVGHSRRVAELARRIAHAMGLAEAQQQQIVVAALLHDIGLVGLGDDVLHSNLPRLGPQEAERYRRHPALGEQALLGLDDMAGCAVLVRAHHERWDGQGYPDGRRGEDIPLGARILGVADTFDDLCNGHLVTAALSPGEARALMARGRGSQFDPAVIDAFLGLAEPKPPLHKAPARVVASHQLAPGMVLARDLLSREGLVLLTAEQVLSDELIQRIRRHEQREGLRLVLQVKRTRR